MSHIKLITSPTTEALMLDELKDHLRVTDDDSDTRLEMMIRAARLAFESYCNRALITSTWEYTDEDFDCSISLPAPVTSITSVKYYDTANVEQTLSATYYVLDDRSEPARLALAYGYVWPAVYCRPNAVTIRFVSGYASADAVPEDIRIGLLWYCESIFDNNAELAKRALDMWPSYRWWPV